MSVALLSVVLMNIVLTANCAQAQNRPLGSLPSGLPAVPGLRPPMAVNGQPFGVFVLELPVPPGATSDELRLLVRESQGRIFYPATAIRTVEVKEAPQPLSGGRLRPGGLIDRVRTAIRTAAEPARRVPVSVMVAGLYEGEAPLQLEISGDVRHRVTVVPVASNAAIAGPPPGLNAVGSPIGSSAAHTQLLNQWWQTYTAQIQRAERTGDHPLLMQKYLAHMLAHRLNLPWPPATTDPDELEKRTPKKYVEPLNSLALLSGIEALRDQILDELLTPAQASNQPWTATRADSSGQLPLPKSPTWQSTILPASPAEVPVESLATRVPAECFYLRFGSFSNYLWFQDLSARNGGDLAQIVLVRGFNYETSRRMERMLNTRMNALSKMFGDQVISDMAIIGRDLYMKEGASLGALFATKNKNLLMSSLDNERKQAVGKNTGATLQTVKIAGRDVSFLSTPDNSVRSFLVGDGDHVLLTTSRYLVERFLKTADGEPSLATLQSFRWARQWMPESNGYTLFAYFSPEFFHGLVSPQYQIELRRRLDAIAHLEVAEVASRAAAAEGIEPDVPAMIARGLLPTWFEERPDGARALRTKDGSWVDSLRGARGSFLPIVDVEVSGISAVESERYNRLAQFYETKWQQMDPMLVGLRRFQVEGDSRAERIGLEAYLAPFAREKYGWLADMLAPAAPVAIATPPDDVVSVQMLMNGTTPLTAPRMPYHLFAGVKDMVPPDPGDTKGLIQTYRALKSTPGYLGAYPQPGYLDQLPLGLGGGRPDITGVSRSIIGLYRWQSGGFSLLSFDRSILDNTRQLLAPVQAEDSAQIRLNVRNLEGSQLSGWINDQWYDRAYRASRGNAILLDEISQQLKVPSSEARAVAESMLDVKLACPLGGTFEFRPLDGGAPRQDAAAAVAQPQDGWWSSSAWATAQWAQDGSVLPPAEYKAPWLMWFRGAQLHLTQMQDRLAVVGTIDVQRQPPSQSAAQEAALPALNFDLFQLPLKMFGGGSEKPAPAKPEKRSF